MLTPWQYAHLAVQLKKESENALSTYSRVDGVISDDLGGRFTDFNFSFSLVVNQDYLGRYCTVLGSESVVFLVRLYNNQVINYPINRPTIQ